MLAQKKIPGRPKIIPKDVRSHIKEELKDPQGFKSYEEVQRLLLASEGFNASYKVVHEVVCYKLKAKLRAPRPRSVKQSSGLEEDLKKLPSWLELIKKYLVSPLDRRKIRYWCGGKVI